MTERKLCSNCGYQKSVGVSIACQRCFNKSLWKSRNKTMTKEELENRKLERRAKEWLVKDKGGSIVQSLMNLIKEFTEPREKQIQIDAEQIRALQKQNGELTDELSEAKEIIRAYKNIYSSAPYLEEEVELKAKAEAFLK